MMMKFSLLLLVGLLVISTAKQIPKEYEAKVEQMTNTETEKDDEFIFGDNRNDEIPQDNFPNVEENDSNIPHVNSERSRVQDYPHGPWFANDNPIVSQQVCSIGTNRDRDLSTIGRSKKVISGYNQPFYIQITDDGRSALNFSIGQIKKLRKGGVLVNQGCLLK